MGLPVCPIRTRGAQRQLPGPQEEQVLLKEIAAVAGRINKHKTNVQSFKEHVEKQCRVSKLLYYIIYGIIYFSVRRVGFFYFSWVPVCYKMEE